MKNLFIDTNVLLSFFHFSGDDLVELQKLVALLQQGELKLFLPDQVGVEFHRNRERKIADALDRLRSQKLSLQFPQMSKDYPEYSQLREAQKEYSRLHGELIARIEVDVRAQSLQADSVIGELFDLAKSLATSDELVSKARLRMEIGNPPGKKGSLGDAIIWEALLDAVPAMEDLNFVSEDGDYFSAIDSDELDPFLVQEWTNRNHSELVAFSRISQFFRSNYPQIELASQLEKESLITRLAASSTFRRTHEIVAELSTYVEFTDAEISQIASAAVSNDQVNWIINDDDIRSFLVSTIKPREEAVDYRLLLDLNQLMEEEIFQAIPF